MYLNDLGQKGQHNGQDFRCYGKGPGGINARGNVNAVKTATLQFSPPDPAPAPIFGRSRQAGRRPPSLTSATFSLTLKFLRVERRLRGETSPAVQQMEGVAWDLWQKAVVLQAPELAEKVSNCLASLATEPLLSAPTPSSPAALHHEPVPLAHAPVAVDTDIDETG